LATDIAATPSFDWSPDSLMQEWDAAKSSSATPAQETPAEPPATEGSTPAVEAAPAPVPAESPSAAQPPAPVEEDQDLAFALSKAGISKDDPQALSKLAKLYRETNNRTAQFANELETLKKAPPAAAQPAPQPVTPPVAAAPPQAHPVEPQQTAEQYAEQLVQQDRDYQYLAQEYRTLATEQASIATHDHQGRLTGGRIAELNTQISTLKAYLTSNEAFTKLGLKAPELDEFQQQEIRTRVSVLEAEKAAAQYRFLTLKQQRADLEASGKAIKQRYADHYASQQAERERAEQEEKEINTEAVKFASEWKNSFETLTTAKKVPEKLLKPLWNTLKRFAQAHDGPIEHLNQWMAAETEEWLNNSVEFHRLQAAEYAKQKREDVAQNTQPNNPAAVAPPTPGTTKTGDWEADLLGNAKQVFGPRW
jgi:hypothetical protein